MANLHIDSAVKVGNTKYNLYDLVTSVEELKNNVKTLNTNVTNLTSKIDVIGTFAWIKFARKTYTFTRWTGVRHTTVHSHNHTGDFTITSNGEIVIGSDGIYICYGELSTNGDSTNDLMLYILSSTNGTIESAYGGHNTTWSSISTMGIANLKKGDKISLESVKGGNGSYEILTNSKLIVIRLK